MAANIEELSAIVVDTSFHIHNDLGPGLYESVYERLLAEKLARAGLSVKTQHDVDIRYDGIAIERAFRIDILVEEKLIIEVKSVDQIVPVHAKQMLTYLRLTELPLGLIINFGAETLKQGIRRLVNRHTDFASSRLRANQNRSANQQ